MNWGIGSAVVALCPKPPAVVCDVVRTQYRTPMCERPLMLLQRPAWGKPCLDWPGISFMQSFVVNFTMLAMNGNK